MNWWAFAGFWSLTWFAAPAPKPRVVYEATKRDWFYSAASLAIVCLIPAALLGRAFA